jgi:cell division protein FtsA
MEEIINAIVFQLERSDSMDKLKAGIVLTGGGSQLRHLPQYVKYLTGLDVRVGMPNVLGGTRFKEVNQPMFSTSVGLLYKGFEDIIREPEPAKKPEKSPEVARPETINKNTIPDVPLEIHSGEKIETDGNDVDMDAIKPANTINRFWRKIKEQIENALNDDPDGTVAKQESDVNQKP